MPIQTGHVYVKHGYPGVNKVKFLGKLLIPTFWPCPIPRSM